MGLFSSSWEIGQTLWGLFLNVDTEGGRPRGVWLAKEERSFLTRKPLLGVWSRLETVSLLEGQVRSGAEFNESSLHFMLTVMLP